MGGPALHGPPIVLTPPCPRLVKDELDAAEHVIKSRADIRQVLTDNDRTGGGGGSVLFGSGEGVSVNGGSDMYDGLGKDGSPIVMQAEMNNTAGGGKKKGGGGGKGGGKPKKKK